MKLKILFILSLSFFSLGVSKCNGGSPPELDWAPKVYVGDSETQSIVRQEAGQIEQIFTADKKFDSMVCMDKAEPRHAIEAVDKIINACAVWKNVAGTETAEVLIERLKLVEEAAKYEPRK